MPQVLFIVPYPLRKAPSQRFRVELFESVLLEAGISYHIEPFLDEGTGKIIYSKGNNFSKITGIFKSYLRRWMLLFEMGEYDYVFIHREAAPLGPPVFEWLMAKLLKKKIIYDFDDAIWIPNTSKENKLAAWLKAFGKVKHICKWSYKISAGNQFLADFAKQYNERVIVMPTCVDTESGHQAVKTTFPDKPVVGWTGSHSTLFYLNEMIPVITSLQETIDFEFLVIADRKPDLDLKDFRYIKWNAATENEDLLQIDIGIMPLKEDAWSEGKCGFKLIQYMACGIPALADPIGVNKKIIEDGINGFLCHNKEDWYQHLKRLLTDKDLRKKLGENGRKKIVNEYSVQAHKEEFVKLFE